MSDVDKRVVQMDFDNKKFEKNVKQSTESLNTLKASLNFDGVSKSIDQVTVKINRMEYVAAAAITNITNRVINFGIQMVKSLSIDNIAAGWAKFGQKTVSIATLMAQTLKVNGKELTDTVEKLSTVNGLMEKLVWFSDETSYSFTDMVDNAGKFIAAGLDLDVSVKAMEGIATWAAISGQNASTASRAMYQLSQAMGKGKIQLIDWKSIQTANMDTAQFRQNVLETAVAMGQLTKEGEKFVTKTGKKFTQSQFTEQLNSGWFTSDVLTKTLEKYSSAADEIYKIAEKEGLTASEVIEKYGGTLDEFGVKAFKAAQEARTLSDALNSVKDAVTSKWMTTSELIFGDKDDAVKLWTDLANELYEVFAESGNFRNEILKVWKSLEGRKDLFEKGGPDQGAFWNIYDAIIALKQVIKDAWDTIFPISQMQDESDQAQEIGNGIKVLTSRFKEFTKTLKLSEANSLRLKKVFEGVFSVLKGLLTLVKAARFIIDPIVDVLKQLATKILDKIIILSGKIKINSEGLLKISDKIHDGLVKLFDDLSNILGSFGKILSSLFNKIADFFKKAQLLNKVKTIFANLGNQIKKLTPFIEKIKEQFADLGEKIKSAVNAIINSLKSLVEKTNTKSLSKKLVKPMNAAMLGLKKSVESVGDSSSINQKTSFFSAMKELFSSIYELLIGILSIGTSIILLIAKTIKVIAQALKMLGDGLVSLINGNIKLEGWQKSLLLTAGIIAGIAALIAIIGKMAYNVFYTVASIIAPWGAIADSISGLIDKIGLQFIVNFVKAFSDAIVKISVSLLVIASINPDRLWPAVGVVGAMTVILAALVAGMIFALKQMNKVQQTTALALIPMQQTKSNIYKIVDSVRDLISEVKRLLAANAIAMILNSFGVAMIQVALALYILAKIEPARMWEGVGVMSVVTAIVLALSQFSRKAQNGIKNTGFIVLELLALSAVIKSMGKILNTFKNITTEQLKNLKVIFIGLVAFLGVCLLFLTKLNDISKNVDDIKTSKKMIKELSSLAALLLSFAVSVKILSTIPWNTLGVTLGIVGGFFVEFGLLVWALSEMSEKYSDFNSKDVVWKEMLSISSMLFSFAVSVAILSSINWATLGVTMGVIGGFLFEVLGFLKILNLTINKNPDVIDKVAKQVKPDRTVETLNALTGLLFVFASSVKILSTIPWNTLGVTLGVIGGFLAELAGFIALINTASMIGYTNTIELDKLIKSLSGVLLSMAISFKILSTIPWNTLGVTLGVIGGVLVALGGLVIAVGYAAKLASGATVQLSTIGAFIALLASITIALKILSGIDTDKILASAGAIGMIIGAYAGMIILLTKVKGAVENIGPVIAGFLAFSLGLVAVGGALSLVAKQPWNQILAAAGAISIVIAALTGMVTVMKILDISGLEVLEKIIGMSVGIITFSGAMVILALAMQQFESVEWESIKKSFISVAGAIVVLALATALSKMILPAIIGLASAFVMVGTGMMFGALSIQILIKSISELCSVTSQNLEIVKNSLSQLASVISSAVSPLISSFLMTIRDNLPIIIDIVNDVLAKILELVIVKIPEIITAAVSALNDLVTKVVDVINNILKTLGSESNINAIVGNIFIFVKNLVNAIVNNISILGEIVDGLFTIVKYLLAKLSENVINIAGDIAEVLLTLLAAAIQIVIASLGALSRLFMVLVASVLLIIGQTFAGLGKVILEVAKVIIKSLLSGIVDAIIYMQDAFAAIGMLVMQLIARGLISVVQAGFGWLFDIIDKIFGTNIKDSLQAASDGIANAARDTINNLDGSLQNVKNAIRKTSNNINDVVQMAVDESNSAVSDGIKQIGGAVKHASDNLSSTYQSLGQDAAAGYSKGINDGSKNVANASANMVKGGIGSAQTTQDSHSPSKVFAKLGMWAAIGYANGIAENQQASSDIMTQMVTNAITAAQNTIDSQNGDDLTIKVGMDISGVEEQSRNISSIMSGINNVTATAYGKNASYTSRAMRNGSTNGSIINTDNSKAVTYNNVFNVTSTDPQKSADEIDKALSRQAMMAKLAHGGI